MRTRLLLILFFVATSRAYAQAPSPTPEGGAAPTSTQSPGVKLDEQQTAIRERVTRLEDRLFQLNQAIRKAEPEKAARLLETLGASRSLMVRQKMDEIIKKLEDRQFADALDKEQIVAADLQALLKGLLEEPDHSAKRKEESDKLKEFRKSLDNIIQEQKQERQRAAEVAEAEDVAKRVKAAKERIMDLAQKQAALGAKTSRDAASKDLAPQQKNLAEQTQKAADNLAPAGESDPALKDAAESMKKAADQMRAAQQSLEKGQTDEAQPQQKSAEEALQSALEKLDKTTKSKLQKLEEQAENQDQTANKTEQLSQDSDSQSKPDSSGQKGGSKEQKQSDDQKSPDGDQKSGSPSDSKEQEQQETPGKKSVKEAVPQQKQAADELRKKDAKKALKKQDEALKKLEQAKEELEDRLEQLRKEQQEELLAALETRFRAMLARQVECTKGTRRLNDLQRDKWKRTDQLALAELANTERGIGDEAEKALYILKEEGTTVIFPQIIEQVRDDSRDAGDKMASGVVGLPARTLQEGIEQALRELLDAIKKKQEENESGENSGSGGNQDQSNPPLLPSSAELKLLRSCQMRVNKMTDSIRAQREDKIAGDQVTQDLQKLSLRQQQVSEMARQMHESMTKPQ